MRNVYTQALRNHMYLVRTHHLSRMYPGCYVYLVVYMCYVYLVVYMCYVYLVHNAHTSRPYSTYKTRCYNDTVTRGLRNTWGLVEICMLLVYYTDISHVCQV